jgi:hypothetical protein
MASPPRPRVPHPRRTVSPCGRVGYRAQLDRPPTRLHKSQTPEGHDFSRAKKTAPPVTDPERGPTQSHRVGPRRRDHDGLRTPIKPTHFGPVCALSLQAIGRIAYGKALRQWELPAPAGGKLLPPPQPQQVCGDRVYCGCVCQAAPCRIAAGTMERGPNGAVTGPASDISNSAG